MSKADISSYKTFDDVTGRLDEIVDSVRDKQTSLEHSLDLFDEAIALGSKAVDMVDKVDFTPEELERLAGEAASSDDFPVSGSESSESDSVSEEKASDAGEDAAGE